MKRLLLALLLLILLPSLARANSSARGWCEVGAQGVTTSGLVSTTLVQASYPSCTVTVLLHGGGTATIYSDNSATPLSNPFTSTVTGQWTFFAANGHYDITLSGGGLVSPVTYSDVILLDLQGSGAVIANTQVAFGSGANTIAGDNNFTWNNTAKSLSVTNSGLSGIAPIYALALGVTGNEAGVVAQCQQLGNFFCEAGQFVASDSGAGPIGSVIGIALASSHTATGTLATFTGLDLTPAVGNGAGAITTSRGIHVAGITFPTGTSPTTHDGIKIDDQCAGAFPATTCIGLNVAAQSNGKPGIVSAAPVNATGGGTFAGAFTHSGTETFSGPLNSTNTATGVASCITNGEYTVGSSCYATIQSAITAAGVTGSVLIPASYAGTDVYTNASNIPIIDKRGATSVDNVRLWSGLSASYPVTGFPLGNDLRLVTHGPADMPLVIFKLATTTTANLSVGANNNVLVGSFSCTNGANTCTLPLTGTANLSPPPNGILIIGRETANQETVTQANWSVVDATHLNITAAKTHSGTTDIEQLGSLIIDASTIIMNCKSNVPANAPAGDSAPCKFIDAGSFTELLWPTYNPDSFPYNAFQFGSFLTGLNGANSDLVIRNSTASSLFKIINAGNTGNSFSVDDPGNGILKASVQTPVALLSGYARFAETTAPSATASFDHCYGDSTLHAIKCAYNGGTFFQLPQVITATSAGFATATTAGTCVQNATAVTGATTAMTVSVSPVSTPGVGAVWSAFVSSAGNITINECAVAASAGGTIAFNIRVTP